MFSISVKLWSNVNTFLGHNTCMCQSVACPLPLHTHTTSACVNPLQEPCLQSLQRSVISLSWVRRLFPAATQSCALQHDHRLQAALPSPLLHCSVHQLLFEFHLLNNIYTVHTDIVFTVQLLLTARTTAELCYSPSKMICLYNSNQLRMVWQPAANW